MKGNLKVLYDGLEALSMFLYNHTLTFIAFVCFAIGLILLFIYVG